MHIDFLLEVFQAHKERDALVWRGRVYSFQSLYDSTQQWIQKIRDEKISPGAVVALEADFSPQAIAFMLGSIEEGLIIVPLTKSVEAQKDDFCKIAEVEYIITVDDEGSHSFKQTPVKATHPLLKKLKDLKHPGLILFSSGSTGVSKAVVHDFTKLLDKYKEPRSGKRTVTFLLFDHIGGINTLFYVLSSAGCIITVEDRSPDKVCEEIEKYKVQILPVSPTFINLLLLSEAYENHDLSSLELVTYGTEVMPETTLKRVHTLFPKVKFLQTYGLSELGILRSKSKDSNSLWVKVGGDGFATRVIDDVLHIKAASAMMGYLNAPDPFTEDGWFNTGDFVETEGDYMKILGRKSEMINVGGQKLFPAETESILQQMEGVEDVAVCGEPNIITGQIVKARVKLSQQESLVDFRKRMRQFCRDRLAQYKIPQKIVLVDAPIYNKRFKKIRREAHEHSI